MASPKRQKSPGHLPRPAPRLYVREYLELRGRKAKELADALDVSEAAVSRWIDNLRQPRPFHREKIEKFLQVPPGGLHTHPSKATADVLLADLDESQQASALDYIQYLRAQKQ